MTTRTELEIQEAAALANYRRATILAADGDDWAITQTRILWADLREVRAALRDFDIVHEVRAEATRRQANRSDRESTLAAIVRGEDALAERVVVARRLISLVTELGTAVTEWERLTATVRASLVSSDERTANALHAALHPAEALLAGLLGWAVPALSREDMAWPAHHCGGMDWPAGAETGGEGAAAVLFSQLDDEPPEDA